MSPFKISQFTGHGRSFATISTKKKPETNILQKEYKSASSHKALENTEKGSR